MQVPMVVGRREMAARLWSELLAILVAKQMRAAQLGQLRR
jgi:hypothetical protein